MAAPARVLDDGWGRLDDLAGDLLQRDVPANPYHDRVRAPAETLALVRARAADLGITRIGLLTGLDVVGLPVAFATRPNSYSLSVFQGKGIDVDSALASAAMEAFETRVAEVVPADAAVASLRDFERSGARGLDLERTARCVPDRIDRAAPLAWCDGLDLVSGTAIRVPFDLVGLDHRLPRREGFEGSTDGLASGNGHAEATFHALCELVERDAWTLLRLRPDAALADAVVDPRSAGDPVLDVILTRIERAGLKPLVLDMTTDVGVPAYMAVLIPGGMPSTCDLRWSRICGGCGCHPDAARAIIRALTEAVQSRLTAIAGSRDDFDPRIYTMFGTAGDPAADAILALAAIPGRPVDPPPAPAPERSIQQRLDDLVAALRGVGVDQVAVVPLASPVDGLRVVRVVVPGLEVDLEGCSVRVGARAARVAAAGAP